MPHPPPLVSVIVPIYNGEADLPTLLAGLLAQTYAADRVEYLLVDNASRDRTPEMLDAAVAAAKAQGQTLYHLTESQIQSSYAARNCGIRAAIGEILAFTDADCQPQPDWLAELVQPFVNPAVGIVAGEVAALPSDNWLEQYAERQGVLSQKNTLAHSFCPYGQTANLAIRRTALEKVGFFRPYLTTGGDADLCWRLQREGGWEIRFAEAALVRHRHRSTLTELRKQWQRYGQSNQYLNQLHGVPLMRSLHPQEIGLRLARWLLKELPITLYRLSRGQVPAIDVVSTPLGLYCHYARTQGQRQAQLPAAARSIDPPALTPETREPGNPLSDTPSP